MAEDGNRVHVCVLCDRILESKAALQMHFRKHANKEIDNKGAPARPRIVKRALKKDTPAQRNVVAKPTTTIACDVCGQEFARNTLAIQHKFRKHPEVSEKFFCPHCGMQFTIKTLHERHVRTHAAVATDGIKSVKCPDCPAEFYTQSAQEYHHKSTHKRVMTLFQPVATAPPSKKIRINNAGEIQSVYFCHLCGSEYIIKFNLQKHLEKAHTELDRARTPAEMIRCTICDALFYSCRAYENHNIGHKPDDLYVTSEQQRLLTVTRVDQDFDIRRVLPLALKYVPTFRYRPRTFTYRIVKSKSLRVEEDNEEMSPPPTPDSSDSDSQSGMPSAEPTETKSDNGPLVITID